MCVCVCVQATSANNDSIGEHCERTWISAATPSSASSGSSGVTLAPSRGLSSPFIILPIKFSTSQHESDNAQPWKNKEKKKKKKKKKEKNKEKKRSRTKNENTPSTHD